MNVIVDTKRPGFIENDWLGRELAIVDAARLNVTLPDPRCVMTTLAQGDLPKDTDVLRALVRHEVAAIVSQSDSVELEGKPSPGQ